MVRLPDAAGQVRNVPVKVLRGIFAGIGQLLLAADRFRAEDAAHKPAADADQHDPLTSQDRQQGEQSVPDSGRPPEPARFRSLDSTGNVRILPPAKKSGRSSPATKQAPRSRPAPKAPPALPVPGYDGLSLPSLRSRLRNLDAAQLRVLVSYEKAHAGRPDVVTMFERRIAKLEAPGAGGTGGKAAGPDAT